MTRHDPDGLKVLLVDDHMAVRQGLTLLLGQAGHTVAAQAQSLEEARRLVETLDMDLALVDLSLADHSGLDLLGDLAARGVPALIYSMYEDCETIEKAFKAGATGYVTKREVAEVLLEAVARVAMRERYVSPYAARSLAVRVIAGQPQSAVEALSDREHQILTLLGQGESNAEIAASLRISHRTVESYCARIIAKLGLEGMRELRKCAIGFATSRR